MQQDTPLTRALSDQNTGTVTPLDALEAGRRRWLDCERISMGAVAEELGVNRATLFRWVGNRHLFTGEIIWSFYRDTLERIREKATGQGPDYVVSVCEELVRRIASAEPLHHFIRQDPEYAIRILTSKSSVFQARSVDAIRQLIAEQVEKTNWKPPINIDDLAFLIVRIGESFLYGDVISGQKTDIAQTTIAFRLLLSGRSW